LRLPSHCPSPNAPDWGLLAVSSPAALGDHASRRAARDVLRDALRDEALHDVLRDARVGVGPGRDADLWVCFEPPEGRLGFQRRRSDPASMVSMPSPANCCTTGFARSCSGRPDGRCTGVMVTPMSRSVSTGSSIIVPSSSLILTPTLS
jgi:hypothetical protein